VGFKGFPDEDAKGVQSRAMQNGIIHTNNVIRINGMGVGGQFL
jgi:hypothetical protein